MYLEASRLTIASTDQYMSIHSMVNGSCWIWMMATSYGQASGKVCTKWSHSLASLIDRTLSALGNSKGRPELRRPMLQYS